MVLEENIVSIIRELVQFLESLDNVELPTAINTMRENLLSRSKIAIHALSLQQGSLPTEQYLYMRVGKELSFLDKTGEIEEYVDADKPQSEVSKDYYESFAEVQEEPKTPVKKNTNKNAVIDNVLSIYKNFTAEQTKDASYKCGPLEIREGKKFFLFEQYRKCWVGLVGTHLIMYKDVKDSRPYDVLSIRDYKCRPAHETITNDPRKNDRAFEIFNPGNTTMLFIARTPKDMEQWMAAICQFGSNESDMKLQNITNHVFTVRTAESDVAVNESISIENYQDVVIRESTTGVSLNRSATIEKNTDTKKENDRFDSMTKDTVQSDETPPPLPTRLPCLMSKPKKFPTCSYDPVDDMDDDIYQKIQEIPYENITNSKRKSSDTKKDDQELYDDVPTVIEKDRAITKLEVEKQKSTVQNAVKDLEEQDTYDDAVFVRLESNDQNKNSQKQVLAKVSNDPFQKKSPNLSNQRESLCYDDVHEVIPQEKRKKQKQKTKEELQSAPQGSLQKRSIFSRVMRRDSPKKEGKKSKPNSPQIPINIEELPIYDDSSSLVAGIIPHNIELQKYTPTKMDETSEYNLPPPPKPIYNSPAVANQQPEPIEEYYSDIANLQTNGMDQNKAPIPIIDKEELMDSEHYQTPKNDPVILPIQNENEEEDLYDDVVIVAAKARLRGLAMKEEKEADGNKFNNLPSPEKKLWNSFKAGWKNKLTEDSSLGRK